MAALSGKLVKEGSKEDNMHYEETNKLSVGNLSSAANFNPLNIGAGSNEGNTIPSTVMTPSIDWIMFPMQMLILAEDINNNVNLVNKRLQAFKDIQGAISSIGSNSSREKINNLKSFD